MSDGDAQPDFFVLSFFVTFSLPAKRTTPFFTVSLGPIFDPYPFGDRIIHDGYARDREAYWHLVASADWVHSTARHEFFGVAVVEALLAGCLPWLPMRLSDPEILPACARGLDPGNPPTDVAALRGAILEHLAPAVAPNAVRRIEQEIEHACR